MSKDNDFNTKIRYWINELKREDINGYITGSCLLDADFNTWTSKPDIDVFVPSDRELIKLVTLLQYKHGFKLGSMDTDISRTQEEKKMQWVLQGKQNKKGFTSTSLATIKVNKNDVIINISTKYGQRCLAAVLCDFDMSIIMQGWDIKAGVGLDLRKQWTDSTMVAVPNPLRIVNDDMIQTAYFVRQFDRVIKYWDRGYDTRAVAKHDLDLIDAVLAKGNIWTSEASQEFYDKFANEFIETRERIAQWLKDKED